MQLHQIVYCFQNPFDATKLVNKLFLDATDPASREPEYKICAARIRKA